MQLIPHFKICFVQIFKPFLCIINYITSIYAIFQSLKNVPGLEGNILISSYQFIRLLYSYKSPKLNTCVSTVEVLSGLNRIYGQDGIYKFWLFHTPMVCLTKAKTVKNLLRCKENVQKSILYSFMKPWLRDGLLTSDTEKWRVHRKLLAPTMYPKIIESYSSIFQEQSLVLANKLAKEDGRPVDFLPIISHCTLDIICETAMGVKLHLQDVEDSIYFKSLHKLCCLVIDRISRLWLWPDFLFSLTGRGSEWKKALYHTRNFTHKVIEERKRTMETRKNSLNNNDDPLLNRKYSLPFLDLALDLHLTHKSFTLQNVQDEVEVFLLGGHDTSAVTLSWALYLLGLDQDVQSKVHQELDDIFGDDLSIPVTPEDAKRLKYLECVIKETLRLFPPVPVVGRELRENLTIGDKTILKGTTCVMLLSEVHRDPEIYTEPEKFNPERFSQTGGPPLDPFAFLAFSAGPRGCPGYKFAMLQMKTVLSTVLRRFTVKSLLPRDKTILSLEMVQRPFEGIELTFLKR